MLDCACRFVAGLTTILLLVLPLKPLMMDTFHDTPAAKRYLVRALEDLNGICEAALAWRPSLCRWPRGTFY